jgi:hypothetical protein
MALLSSSAPGIVPRRLAEVQASNHPKSFLRSELESAHGWTLVVLQVPLYAEPVRVGVVVQFVDYIGPRLR